MPFLREYTQRYCSITRAKRWRSCEHAHTLTGTESKHVLLIDILNFVDNLKSTCTVVRGRCASQYDTLMMLK